MKINIHVNDKGKTEVPGYLNLTNLDTIENGEATEIVALNVIDHYSGRYVPQFIGMLSKKLEHGGVVSISGTNLETAVKSLYRRDINTFQFNNLVFGEQGTPCEHKSSCHDVQNISGLLTQAGLKIVERRLVGVEYIIKAVRP